jgi:hypothetical protein
MIKTLIGKNNYLFLINDSSQSLDVHTKNINKINISILNIYNEYIKKKKILLIVFPDKEGLCWCSPPV